MDNRINLLTEPRIGALELSQEKFKPTGIKESTHHRLGLAKKEFYHKPAYMIIEEALELYYANTLVNTHQHAGLLQDIINLQDAEPEY